METNRQSASSSGNPEKSTKYRQSASLSGNPERTQHGSVRHGSDEAPTGSSIDRDVPLGERPTPVLSSLWPNGDRAASCGTPAPGAGSSSKTSRSMTSHAVDEKANIKLSNAEDLQRARKETMKVEL